jgi:integrase
MIYKQKGSRYYFAKFRWMGQLIHRSTHATDKKTARVIEGKMRTELARGNWGILEKKPSAVLSDFLNKDFLAYVDSTAKESTGQYYHDGAKRLLASGLGSLPLDQITDQHAGQFAARLDYLSPSTVNCGLRTLRRALRLAFEWGRLDRMPKISLAKGERQRDRVLTDDEATRYLAACPQPWKDVATLILGTGMRPGECYPLRWEHVLLNGHGGLIQIVQGKTKAARRLLPMVPEVYRVMKARHDAQGKTGDGWVFPSGSRSGHLEESSAKQYHAKALAALAKAYKGKPQECPEVKAFEPYCLRHTALTWIAQQTRCDAWTMAKIAGHSSIMMTQRYIHPQAEAIERAFLQMGTRQELVIDGGQSKKIECWE